MKGRKTLLERFEDKYIPEPNSGCWLWIGSICGGGYGKIWDKTKIDGAHRLSYRLFKGSIYDGLYVLHTCDQKLCVNPDHLFLGTHNDNMNDRQIKGRQPKEESHGRSKLCRAQVNEIRRIYSEGNTTNKLLAEQFNVSPQLISIIINYKVWK